MGWGSVGWWLVPLDYVLTPTSYWVEGTIWLIDSVGNFHLNYNLKVLEVVVLLMIWWVDVDKEQEDMSMPGECMSRMLGRYKIQRKCPHLIMYKPLFDMFGIGHT